ncbi:VapC toxin family PIN domain ribonuclease [Archaeoglobales archaeon]|nr:MAG: VapC toxin family PIN domain ribonuclease [Archaeoglobales archaeon]
MIFFDTSAMIALADRKDKNHERAVRFFREAVRKTRFVLAKHVLIEYIDGVTKRVGKEEAVKELKNILNSKLIVIQRDRPKDWDKAIEYFFRYSDREIDLTDCLSFAMMERLRLKEVFTFDSDFRIHGFKVVPG